MEPAGIITALGGWIGVLVAGPTLGLIGLGWYGLRAWARHTEVTKARDEMHHAREMEGVRWREREVAALRQVTSGLLALQSAVQALQSSMDRRLGGS